MPTPEPAAIAPTLRAEVLQAAVFRCANPECRGLLTVDVHHLHAVDDSKDSIDGWCALCPRCHAMHLAGIVSVARLRGWWRVHRALHEAFGREGADMLLVLRDIDDVSLGAEGLLRCAGLLGAGLLEIRQRVSALVAGQGSDIFKVRLSAHGRQLLDGWIAGNQLAACVARERR